ncbi:MAG TPA: hypothetical protein VGF14_07045 [Alphaproteobacteria bacterium]
MTENRGRPTPPPRTAPLINPSHTPNNTPTNTSSSAPVVVPADPDLITEKDILENIGSIALMLLFPDKITEDKKATLKAFTQLTIHSVGNKEFQGIHETTVKNLLKVGGRAGAEIVETLQKQTDDRWTSRTEVISRVRKASIFGDDESTFLTNYAAVSKTLNDAYKEHVDEQKQKFKNSLGQLIETSNNMLSGQGVPLITVLTPDERKKHIPVPEPV